MQQHGSKYLPAVSRPKFNFFRAGPVAYQIKGNQEMQQHGSKYFARRPPPPSILGIGSVGQNSTFSEQCNVAYQIKENQECSKLVANILPVDPLPRL